MIYELDQLYYLERRRDELQRAQKERWQRSVLPKNTTGRPARPQRDLAQAVGAIRRYLLRFYLPARPRHA